MSIIGLVLVLLIAGFVFWLIQTAPIPIHPWIKTAIMGVLAIAFLIWILNAIGINTGIHMHL